MITCQKARRSLFTVHMNEISIYFVIITARMGSQKFITPIRRCDLCETVVAISDRALVSSVTLATVLIKSSNSAANNSGLMSD